MLSPCLRFEQGDRAQHGVRVSDSGALKGHNGELLGGGVSSNSGCANKATASRTSSVGKSLRSAYIRATSRCIGFGNSASVGI
jgi:hypothetical protein